MASSSGDVKCIIEAFLKKKKEYDANAEVAYRDDFLRLRSKNQEYRDVKYSCSEGEKPYNLRKNRYKDIVPYDYTRVKLSMLNGVTGTDYINASYIGGPVNVKQYIAAQGPLPNTVKDFWRMLWEQKPNVVIMACGEYEGAPPKHKCERYWPETRDERLQFGAVSVSLENESRGEFLDYLIRELRVECSQEVHRIRQLHYTGWPDHGVPDDLIQLIDVVTTSRQHQGDDSAPLVIHCSAGCGRTGTLIAIDYVYNLLKTGKLNSEFDLFCIVDDMRKQRPSMVQSVDQYRFLFSAVAELFERHLAKITTHAYENVEIGKMAKDKKTPSKKTAEAKSETSSDTRKEQKSAKPTPTRHKPAVPAGKPKLDQRKNTESATVKAQCVNKRESCQLTKPINELINVFSAAKAKNKDAACKRPELNPKDAIEETSEKQISGGKFDSYSVVSIQCPPSGVGGKVRAVAVSETAAARLGSDQSLDESPDGYCNFRDDEVSGEEAVDDGGDELAYAYAETRVLDRHGASLDSEEELEETPPVPPKPPDLLEKENSISATLRHTLEKTFKMDKQKLQSIPSEGKGDHFLHFPKKTSKHPSGPRERKTSVK